MRKMKESGIDWIGKIPENWKIGKVKDIFIRKNEKANDENPTVLSLARSGVKIRDISTGEGQLAESYNNYNPVEIGDLLLNPMDLYSGANCSVSKVKGVISPAYINLRAKGKNNSTYYDYFFKTQYWGMVLFAHGKGVSFDNRWTLGLDTALNYFIPVPKETEQDKIAAFLDKRIYEIDNIIEKTKETIEDYKKIKETLLTNTLTKGINNKERLEEINTKFIDKIPKGWKIMNTIYALKMPITDGPHTTPELLSEGVPFISAEAVSSGNGKIDFSHMRGYISEDFYNECCKKYIPQKDDIYMIKSGATTGKVAIVDTDERFTIWSPLAVFRCNKKIILPKFMFYVLQTQYFQKQIELNWSYGTQQNIGMRVLEKLKIIVPDLNTQIKIIEYLNKKCIEIDNLILNKEKILDELEQYKKSLIYEYVTGKKEVV